MAWSVWLKTAVGIEDYGLNDLNNSLPSHESEKMHKTSKTGTWPLSQSALTQIHTHTNTHTHTHKHTQNPHRHTHRCTSQNHRRAYTPRKETKPTPTQHSESHKHKTKHHISLKSFPVIGPPR